MVPGLSHSQCYVQSMTWSPGSARAPRSVGLCLHQPRRRIPLEPFWVQFMRGVEDALAPRGLSLILQVVVDPAEEIATYRRWHETGQIAGIIVADLVDGDARVPVLRELGLPAVLLAREEIAEDFSTVSTAAPPAMIAVMEHLAKRGHHWVARVTGPQTFLHTRERDAPFREAGERLGIRTATVVSDYTADGGALATQQLIATDDRPTAIVYDNDVMALAGLATLRSGGLRVPEDVAVVAWDDSIQCQLASPPLTALVRDLVDYGAIAANSLFDVLDGRGVSHRRADQPELVERASTSAFASTSAAASSVADAAADASLD